MDLEGGRISAATATMTTTTTDGKVVVVSLAAD